MALVSDDELCVVPGLLVLDINDGDIDKLVIDEFTSEVDVSVVVVVSVELIMEAAVVVEYDDSVGVDIVVTHATITVMVTIENLISMVSCNM